MEMDWWSFTAWSLLVIVLLRQAKIIRQSRAAIEKAKRLSKIAKEATAALDEAGVENEELKEMMTEGEIARAHADPINFSKVRVLVSNDPLYRAFANDNADDPAWDQSTLNVWVHTLSETIVYMYRSSEGETRYLVYTPDATGSVGGIDHSTGNRFEVVATTAIQAVAMREKSIQMMRDLVASSPLNGKVLLWKHMNDMERYYEEEMLPPKPDPMKPKRKLKLGGNKISRT